MGLRSQAEIIRMSADVHGNQEGGMKIELLPRLETRDRPAEVRADSGAIGLAASLPKEVKFNSEGQRPGHLPPLAPFRALKGPDSPFPQTGQGEGITPRPCAKGGAGVVLWAFQGVALRY